MRNVVDIVAFFYVLIQINVSEEKKGETQKLD